MNDVVINKVQSIQRCIERARIEYYKDVENFDTDYTRQDASVLNILRACGQAIDLANHVLKIYKMGIPTSSGESFELLHKQKVIDIKLAVNLTKMVHFRNTLVHQYQKMNIEIVKSVIKHGLDDLVIFTEKIMEFVC